ncbi:AsmA-like C-terminal region-containing protein [Mesorhizobium sp. IMUNJ 23232]|uniref:AsmA family protein n=1 Tax=Mesorhizobium sp. IMUNJ 23232 TaxID=3376064 RepID=UPI00379D46AD
MRRSMWALAILAVLIVVLVITVPYIASTRIVRDRIAQEIGAWSGYAVRIEGSPRIDIWPRLRAVLRDVSFSDAGPGGERSIGTVERIDIELSALAAMRGDTVFTSARLVKPVLRIGAEADRGIWATLAGKGRIRSAIEEARAVVASQADPASLKSLMPAGPFGSIRIEDGSIQLDDGGVDSTPLVTAIEGKVDWPTLDRAGSLVAQGVWKGETIKLDAESAAPMLLFAGGTAPAEISLDSALGGASFSGTANLSGTPFADGQITASTSSFGRLAGWVGAGLPGWEKLQAVRVSGTVSGDARRLKLDGAQLQMNGSTADGAAELVSADGRTTVSGSLAFDTLQLDGLFSALPPLIPAKAAVGAAPGSNWLDPLMLDLRLSAAHASAGGLEMSDMAATVDIQDRFASFEILDATALDGALRGGIRFDRDQEQTVTRVTLSATGIDGAAFGSAIGMNRLAPTGRGSVTFDIKGRGTDIRSVMENGDGRFSARLGAGALSGLDLAAFLERCRKGGFFALDETAGGSLVVDGIDIQGTMTNGVTTLDRAEARFGSRRLWLSGLASYADRSLALTGGVGQLQPVTGTAAGPPDEAKFFVGGSWSAPFISPVKAGE